MAYAPVAAREFTASSGNREGYLEFAFSILGCQQLVSQLVSFSKNFSIQCFGFGLILFQPCLTGQGSTHPLPGTQSGVPP